MQNKSYVIEVNECDFYTIYYAVKMLYRAANAHEDEVKRILDYLDEIIEKRNEEAKKNDGNNERKAYKM